MRELLPNARPLSVHEAMQWCRGAARSEAAADVGARRRPALPSRAWRRRGRRKARGWRRSCSSGSSTCAAWPPPPSRWCRPPSRGSSSASSSAGTRPSRPPARRSRSRARRPQERALNEAAAYAIRIDVAEELARLRSHLDEIARLLAKGGEVGKRLEFLIQELLREANTLGSKSTSLEMTAISVDMKVAIEQLREQVQNVE